jgi:hypothetical protein
MFGISALGLPAKGVTRSTNAAGRKDEAFV